MRSPPRGVALPMTLLLLVLITTLVWAAFVLVHDGLRRGHWEVDWFLSQRVVSSPPAWLDLDRITLGGGYQLERMTVASSGQGPSPQRITWCLSPALEAQRNSFSEPILSGPVLGPLGLQDVLRMLPDTESGTPADPASLRLLSSGAGDFLREVSLEPDIRFAVAQGTVVIAEDVLWTGLLILHGSLAGGGRIHGGIWQWGDPWAQDLLIEDHVEIREQALRIAAPCPEPLYHIADLGRR